MGAQIATPKQTGGGGFNYEDKVGTYFLLCMLLERSPFSSDLGTITRIDLQKAAAGWAFDDYLIILNHRGEKRTVGVSVKSNQQFSEHIIYGGALKLLWEQRLQLNHKVFDPDQDYCCFAQPPLDGTVMNDLNTLINLARQQDPVDLEHNVNTDGYTSKEKLDLYKSFNCPIGLNEDAGKPGLLPGNVLSNLMVLEFDFESVVSKSEAELLQFAAQVLAKPSAALAALLYEKLQQICKDRRPLGGFVELQDLVAELKHIFELRGFPSFSDDLEKIEITTHRNLSIIKTTIGNEFSIDRSVLIADIANSYLAGDFCAVVSPSGYGKTALAKLYVESVQKNQTVLWVNASHFESDLEAKLSLRYSLRALIDANTKETFLIVIDGLERFYSDTQLQHLAILLRQVSSAKGGFKVLFTCIGGDFEDVMLRLYGYGAAQSDFIKIVIDNQKIDFVGLATHFPNMLDLLRNNEIRGLLSNVKILDALSFTLTKSSADEFHKGQVTESEIIDFLWKKIVETGSKGMLYGNVSKLIAKMQADTLYMGISTSAVDPASAAALSELSAMDILYEYEDYLYFQHDLYGDWARYKIIRSHAQEIKSFLLSIDIVSPLWVKAVRQYGIYLLELKSDNHGWLELYQQFDEAVPQEKIIKNVLLESIIFSTGAKENLTRLETDLLAENCSLLRRLLEIFLIKATIVNPGVLKIASTLKRFSATQAAVLNRIPAYEYWLPIIDFIFKHREIVLKDDFYHCARISRDWLTFTPEKTLGRKKMALMAIDLSTELLSEKKYFYADRLWKEKAFEGLLRGYNELPDLAAEVVLKLAGRVKPPERIMASSPEMPIRSYKFRSATKWVDCPFVDPDDVFVDICLNRGMLQRVFELNHQLANEVMLAILIKAPSDDYHRYGGVDDFDLNVPRDWNPAFFRRGPFLNFLYAEPLAALDGIIKLVDFATGQWCAQFEKKDEVPFETLEINGGPKKYYGDLSLFFWYRGIGIPPSSLVSALMAVEYFLYEIHEDHVKVEECISYILKHSESLAWIGMLVSTGKAFPALFIGVLRPFLDIMNFYIWEKHNIISYQFEQYGLNSLPDIQAQEADEWNKIAHRTIPFDDLMINQLMNGVGFRPLYEAVTEKWEGTLSKIRHERNFDIYQDRMLSFFKPENYTLKQYQDDIYYYEYVEPADLASRMAPIRDAHDARQIVPSAFSIFKLLEDDKQMQLADAENLWELLEKLKLRKTKDWFNSLETPLSSILGGYVFLLKFKKVWIDTHPEYYQTIVSYTTITFQRIKKEKITVSNFSVQYSWNTFSPHLVAYLWKDGDLPVVREWITLIFTNFYPESVDILFASLAKLLGWNHPLFIELQNYTLAYASIDNIPPFDDTTGLQAELTALNERFILGEIDKVPHKWEQYRTYKVRGKNKHRKLISSDTDAEFLTPGLNLSLLKFAYKSLPCSNLTGNRQEQNHILFLWKEAFDQVVYQFGEPDKTSSEIDEFPNDFDLWVIQSIPDLISEPIEVEFFDCFAEPLLKFGYITSQWTEIYCTSLFLKNLDKIEHYKVFIPQWQRIVKFCLENENWIYKGGRRDRYLPLSLFLLDPQHIHVWNYDYKAFTTKAAQVFKEFFGRGFMEPPVIKACCRFVKTPSGRQFLKIGLLSVDLGVKYFQERSKGQVPSGKFLQPFYATNELGAFLSKVWEIDHLAIRSDDVMFKCYKDLVVFLISLHDPVGIELQGLLQAK